MTRRLKIALSIRSRSDCYEQLQIAAAKRAMIRHDGELIILDAQNDSIRQSQQLLDLIQSKTGRPDGIILDPVSRTGLPQAACAAAKAGIGWAVLSGQIKYLSELREKYPTPMFSVASDEIEIGKIQGRQLAALLSNGGHVLYLQGPHSSSISHLRLTGFNEAKPPNCNIRSLVSQWTRANASRSVDLWIWLSPIETRISVVVAQSNLIALGCRDALRKNPIYQGSRDLLFIGGGLTPIGSLTTDEEPLDATVHTPSTSGLAIDTLISALRTGTKTPELLSVLPESCETRRTEWQRTILPTDPEAHLQTPMHSFSEVSNES